MLFICKINIQKLKSYNIYVNKKKKYLYNILNYLLASIHISGLSGLHNNHIQLGCVKALQNVSEDWSTLKQIVTPFSSSRHDIHILRDSVAKSNSSYPVGIRYIINFVFVYLFSFEVKS